MERGQIVISKSGKLVELKEKKGALYIAYQLNENLERITERKAHLLEPRLHSLIIKFQYTRSTESISGLRDIQAGIVLSIREISDMHSIDFSKTKSPVKCSFVLVSYQDDIIISFKMRICQFYQMLADSPLLMCL